MAERSEARTIEATRPLTGIRVLDLTQILAGPYCTRLLADAGADVIKIEPPTGDPSRDLPPALAEHRSGYFTWLNCGKRSVVADLSTDSGIDVVRRLAGTADVVVENMRPGSLRAKGLGYEDLHRMNERLIMCSISGFGQSGEYSGLAGQGVIAEGYAGVIAMNGAPNEAPMPLGVSLADVSSGIHAYAAILTALFHRETTNGVGDLIDMALFDGALPFHETALIEAELLHTRPTRSGSGHRSVVPYGVYQGRDDLVTVAAGTERLWQRLARVLSETLGPADVDLTTNDLRLRHRDVVRARIERWLAAQDTAESAVRLLNAAGVPCGVVRDVADVASSLLAVSRSSFVAIPDEDLGEVRVLNTPYRFRNAKVGPAGPAPDLGRDVAAWNSPSDVLGAR